VADAHIDDAVAVRGNLHIVGVFELEDVDGMQASRFGQFRRNGSAGSGHQGRSQHGKGYAIHQESSGETWLYCTRRRNL
jgi:hypothetical protein